MPITDLSDPNSIYNPSLFSYRGRIGRLRYLLTALPLYIVIVFIGAIGSNAVGSESVLMVSSLLMIALMVPFVFTIIKRLHDLKKTGVLWLLIFVPLVNLIFLVYLCLAKSSWSEQGGPDVDGIRIEDIISK